jgi:hypothetical protein
MSGAYAIAEAVAASWLGAGLAVRPSHGPFLATLAAPGVGRSRS